MPAKAVPLADLCAGPRLSSAVTADASCSCDGCGSKRLQHPNLGVSDLEVLELSTNDGLLVAVFTVWAGSRSAEVLDFL